MKRPFESGLIANPNLSSLDFINVAELNLLDRQLLVERQLISRELANSEGARSVAIDEPEQLSLMVNEEDHLRLQVIKSGLDLDGAWELINDLDDEIESKANLCVQRAVRLPNGLPDQRGNRNAGECAGSFASFGHYQTDRKSFP